VSEGERFARAMRDEEVIKDTKLLGDFTVIYCNGNHADAEKHVLCSGGVELGVYGRKVPVVCDECAELLTYAEKRRAFCPEDPKPFCNYCETHCYSEGMRIYMREVMKYAGPRSWKHGYAVEGVRHMIEGKRHKRELERRQSEETKGSTS